MTRSAVRQALRTARQLKRLKALQDRGEDKRNWEHKPGMRNYVVFGTADAAAHRNKGA